ncbi:MAG TPA: hypothetical protein VKZ50_05115 [bacterium]|nr:hypothetical protein [bacterium]
MGGGNTGTTFATPGGLYTPAVGSGTPGLLSAQIAAMLSGTGSGTTGMLTGIQPGTGYGRPSVFTTPGAGGTSNLPLSAFTLGQMLQSQPGLLQSLIQNPQLAIQLLSGGPQASQAFGYGLPSTLPGARSGSLTGGGGGIGNTGGLGTGAAFSTLNTGGGGGQGGNVAAFGAPTSNMATYGNLGQVPQALKAGLSALMGPLGPLAFGMLNLLPQNAPAPPGSWQGSPIGTQIPQSPAALGIDTGYSTAPAGAGSGGGSGSGQAEAPNTQVGGGPGYSGTAQGDPLGVAGQGDTGAYGDGQGDGASGDGTGGGAPDAGAGGGIGGGGNDVGGDQGGL